ncbi:MAG: hypothetical protein CMP23_06450 [Rickettsiales bacterium]|nr:hypothetical protein [Rickettsiales bacterium]|tara:strand:- start:247 stop:777 length:531 start_codon:yes stop_codon:yes gene_type:complete
MIDDAAQSLELRPYERFNRTFLMMTAGLPSLLCVGLFAASGATFWLFPILFLGGGAALNLYLFNAARPIPQRVRLDAHGIAFTTKGGAELSFDWDEVDTVRDHMEGRRYKHHVELRFKNSSEALRLYRTSLKISEQNGQPVDNELDDTMIGTVISWDRPIQLTRSIIARHVPGFEA